MIHSVLRLNRLSTRLVIFSNNNMSKILIAASNTTDVIHGPSATFILMRNTLVLFTELTLLTNLARPRGSWKSLANIGFWIFLRICPSALYHNSNSLQAWDFNATTRQLRACVFILPSLSLRSAPCPEQYFGTSRIGVLEVITYPDISGCRRSN